MCSFQSIIKNNWDFVERNSCKLCFKKLEKRNEISNITVVEIMNILHDYSKRIEHELFIGYFGDTAQNIYNDGIGKGLATAHLSLKLVKKEFNRKSTKEIIDIINSIRNDDIVQQSIFDDCEDGRLFTKIYG